MTDWKKEFRVEDAHHCGAGAGGTDDGVVVGKDFAVTLRQLPGFVPVAGVKGRLAATGLGGGKFRLEAEPAQDVDHGDADLRIQLVNEARNEDGNAHGWQATAATRTSKRVFLHRLYLSGEALTVSLTGQEAKMKRYALVCLLGLAGHVCAETQLTIYNQNFATVKEARSLDLKKGENEVRVTDITAHLETDSVVLRDVKRPDALQILEQNYESDPLSEGLLLRKSEGKTLDFEITLPQTGEKKIVKGKILRSGYVPHTAAFRRYGQQYYATQMAYANPQTGGGQPIVEVNGKVQFGLPGKPLFEALDPKAFLKPTLLWRLWADKAGRHDTEFSYLTGGMRWEASYNAVAPEKGDNFDIIGWVTLENMSGKDFENASVKLMAGDVARARPDQNARISRDSDDGYRGASATGVTERAFEEYHLYSLARPTTVLDREVKQVEFVRAANVPAKRIYVYDGFKRSDRHSGRGYDSIRTEASYGTQSNPKIWVMLEFKNSAKERLGMALPKGKVKIYRRDTDGRSEFIGEDQIDHTPKDEIVRLYTGNAFDIVGERRQTEFKLDRSHRVVDESFEIKIRNHKSEPIEVRVVEHMYRWIQWEITGSNVEYTKTDARTIEFRPKVPADGQAIINYTVHYTW
jgi:hypothetical protein